MSNEKIRELLSKLHDEIEKTDMDAGTRSLIAELDSDIHELLDPNAELEVSESIIGTAQQFDANFATKHPVAERVVREIVETLARMGV